MSVFSLKAFVFCMLIFCFGCNRNTEIAVTKVSFQLNKDSSKIVLKGLDINVLGALKEDSISNENMKQIFGVYVQSSNPELQGLEDPLSGKYQIDSKDIIFTPDSMFIKGKIYAARLHLPDFYSSQDVLTHKNLPGKINTIEKTIKF